MTSGKRGCEQHGHRTMKMRRIKGSRSSRSVSWSGSWSRSAGQGNGRCRKGYTKANLSGADLIGAKLSGVHLTVANLSGTNLRGAKLSDADLRGATLNGAYLGWANLSGADVSEAKMDTDTSFTEIILSSATRLGDVRWNGVPLTLVDWSQISHLGDERLLSGKVGFGRDVRPLTRRERATRCQSIARAYSGLANALRAQSMNPQASGYRLLTQRWERRAMRAQRKTLPWAGIGSVRPHRRLWRATRAHLYLVPGGRAKFRGGLLWRDPSGGNGTRAPVVG